MAEWVLLMVISWVDGSPPIVVTQTFTTEQKCVDAGNYINKTEGVKEKRKRVEWTCTKR